MDNPYVQAFNHLPFPALILEPKDGTFLILDANTHFCRLWKVSGEELRGKIFPFHDTGSFDIPNGEQQLDSLQKVCRTGEPDKIELHQSYLQQFQKGQDRSIFRLIENIPVKNEGGDVVQILHVAIEQSRDLEKKPEIMEEPALNHQEYENFVKKNKDGLYSLDLEGNFLTLNEGLCNMAELSKEEMLQKNFLPFCASHDRERTLIHFYNVLQGKNQEFEAEFISAKGNVLVLEVTLIPMKTDEKISGAYGIVKDFSEFRIKEKELLENQKKFQALIQEGSDLVSIIGEDGAYKFVSENVQNILGLKPEDLVGRPALDFIHPEDKEKVMRDSSPIYDEKQVKIRPFRFKDAADNWRWFESQVTNFKNDPSVQGYVSHSKEISDLIEQSQQIKQLYERYTLAAEATEDLIYDWNLITDEVIRFHKSSAKLFGYSREEIDARDFWVNHIHPEELADLKEQLTTTLADPDQQNIKTQYRFERKDGTYAQIIDRANIIRNEKGEATRLIGATSDVSKLLNNKNALKLANKRFSYAMRATKEIIWDWDIEKGHVKRSSSFKKIFGYNSPQSHSTNLFWLEKIVEQDRERINNSLENALKDPTCKKWREEYCFVRRNGEKAYVIDRGYIIRDIKGTAIRMVGAVLDVTESRKMLKEIKKQNELLKEVAWEQAHIVRAPLARLKGLLNLLEEESYEEWSREELVKLIRVSAEEVDEIISKIVRKTEEIGS